MEFLDKTTQERCSHLIKRDITKTWFNQIMASFFPAFFAQHPHKSPYQYSAQIRRQTPKQAYHVPSRRTKKKTQQFPWFDRPGGAAGTTKLTLFAIRCGGIVFQIKQICPKPKVSCETFGRCHIFNLWFVDAIVLLFALSAWEGGSNSAAGSNDNNPKVAGKNEIWKQK